MKPYTLTVEIARSESTSNPFDVCFSDQEYLVRQEDGYLSARLSWGSQLQEDLAELSQPSPDRGAIQRLGDTLGAFLGKLGGAAHEPRMMEALREGREVHLCFRFAAAELYSLPWELVTLRGSGQHLGELPGCHLRYEWPGVMAPTPPEAVPTEGGRILFAWSAAGGKVPAEEHLRALSEVCARNGYPFDPARDVIGNVSLRSLDAALEASPEPVAALHILCHGSRSPSQEHGLEWNAPEGGGAVFVDPGDLRQTLAPYAGSLRMVVLCACQSGNASPSSHLGSMAQALHRVGIPAVVASRMPLTFRGSVQLTETLYGELLGPLAPLCQALAATRSRLKEDAEHLDWASLQLYARSWDEFAHRPFLFRPYRGLLAFRPQDRRFFFGRAELEEELRERVRQALDGQRPRFQVVAGASGIGKSSVVMAGLLPSLRPEEWDWLVVRPGELVRGEQRSSGERSMAVQELRRRVRQLGSPEPLPASGGASQQELLEEVRRLRQARAERNLLLVLDQFEEVFTLLTSKDRQALLQAVWALSRQPELGCVVVATLRVDLFDRCGEVELEAGVRLDSVVYGEGHRLFVAQMGPEELAEAIERPARKVGLELEAGLVDRLLEDVGQEPGALPLLAHALDLLWQRREGQWLTHRAYEEMEGVAGALTQTAEGVHEELSEAERHQARRLLVRLVAARDMGSPRAQGRVWVEELRPREDGEREAFEAALEKLVGGRLLVQGGSKEGVESGRGAWVQIAHETLLRRWKRLERWVAEDWEREKQLQELEEWAEDWEEGRSHADGGASFLLMGGRLGHARALQERLGDELSRLSQRLIEESLAAEESHQLKEQETQRVIAEARARAERFFRRAFVVTAMLLGVAVAAVAVVSFLRRQEQELRRAGQSMARVLLAEHYLRQDPTKGLLLLREMGSDERNPKWVGTAIDALQHPVARAILRGHGGRILSATFSPDGARVVTASEDGTARIWTAQGQLLAILAGHGGAVLSASFNPEGSRVVTASKDGTARVWSAQGALLAILAGHGDAVLSASFSPGGERAVTASEDGTARLWSADGKLLAVLAGHGGAVLSASFSPGGERVVTASKDGTARVWGQQGQELAILESSSGAVMLASFSPGGDRVVTGSEDGTARVWSTGGVLLATLEGHFGPVLSAAFSPAGDRVVTGSEDGAARVWSAQGGHLAGLEGHNSAVVSVAFSQDGERVVTASRDGTAHVWSVHGRLLAELVGHGSWVVSAAFSPQGEWVVTASADKTARVWSVEGLLSPIYLQGHFGAVLSAAFSPDGQRVVTASADETVQVWSAQGSLLTRLGNHGGAVQSVAFSPDGQRVVTASADMRAQVWSAQGALLAALEGHTGPVWSAAFSPDGQRLVTASADGTARLWSAQGNSLARLEGHTGPVRGAAFSPDGQQVATASADGTARLWSTRGELLKTLPVGGGGVFSATFSPDGQRIVTASEDGTARVWSLRGELGATLLGHNGRLNSAAFSPDGQWVVTASTDGTARVWSVRNGLLATLPVGGGEVFSATFSPDGEWVVTASADGSARVWPVSARLLKERLDAATSDCLGGEERQAYLNETPEEAQAALEQCQLARGGGLSAL